MKSRSLVRRVLMPPLYVVATVVLVVEDFLWEPLQRAAAWTLAKLHLHRLEQWIASLRPYPALALFGVPSVMLFPLKLVALWLMGHGLTWMGIGLLAGAKLGGTAVVARLFTLTRASLLTIGWFSRLHAFAVDVRARASAAVHATLVWRTARAVRARLRAALSGRSRFARRWRSLRARARHSRTH